MNNNEIYIVTGGEYSDYHIVCVFDSLQLAEEFINKIGMIKIKAITIKTYRIDKEFDTSLDLYEVIMDKEGNVKKITLMDYFEYPEHSIVSNKFFYKDDKRYLRNICYAKDEKHAVKITNELRARLIAFNSWE